MWVYLNGNILKSEEARISPLDRSFTFGDGVYEVIPSYNNNLFLFEKHLARLYSSLEKTFIKAPSDLIDLKKILRELHEKNKHKNQFFYVQISRGIQEFRSHESSSDLTPSLFITSQKLEKNPYRNNPNKAGLKIRLEEDVRWQRCDIKTTALIGNILSMHDPSLAKVDEIFLHKNGMINEGSRSNIFFVKDNKVFTPPLSQKILPGITRDFVIDLLRRYEIEISEEEIPLDFIYDTDEIWVTSSTKEIQPVSQIDDYVMPVKKTGKVIWKQLLEAYHHI